jgi:hypothetical protein
MAGVCSGRFLGRRGMDMKAIKNKSINFWPFRHAIIVLFNEKIISREYFIELWRSVYGKG